jgi:hypothetical protein
MRGNGIVKQYCTNIGGHQDGRKEFLLFEFFLTIIHFRKQATIGFTVNNSCTIVCQNVEIAFYNTDTAEYDESAYAFNMSSSVMP